ncbi:BTB/POZ and MATH domain-containing protein 2-like [Oryza brachyantha]|uniref:BTB/POZ and MATH domain-containing protein 2-like n=1 Tax=Oryza brachyantha TaxID=4533 RepID=UPI001ADB416E|nr:BTB/POZ and MATH domain-containing protein 2-like [Oryza brachyantha]
MATATASTVNKSASTIVSSTESGQHLLKIDGYSRIKDTIANGSFIQSCSFTVAGYRWCIRYYPNGSHSYWPEYISLYLYLASYVNQGVRAQFSFSLLDYDGGEPVTAYRNGGFTFTNHSDVEGARLFFNKGVLERSGNLLRDDCFTIRCDLTVVKPPEAKDIDVAARPAASPPVSVPPSDLTRHLGGLLATGEGADVTFEVDGRTFAAHRSVLAARSPVFHTSLFGGEPEEKEDGDAAPAAGGAAAVVRVDDMEAPDFEALLHFIYTDSLPEMGGRGGDEAAMLPDMVAAANRYRMERLRMVCEDKLCKYVNVRTVAAMLAFAGEHHCHGLRKRCLEILDDPASLRNVVETEGLEYLTKSYPLVLKDLIAKFATKS